MLQKLRHDLRGHTNSLMLCAAALSHCEMEEQLEFIDEMISAADQILIVLDELEKLPEHFVEQV